MACDIMATHRTTSVKHEIAAFHGAHRVNDGDGATTVATVNICEKFYTNVSRNCVPEFERLRR